MAVSCLTAKCYLITCITSPFLEKGLGLRWRMPTCISKWRCQLGCTQGQEQSTVCRATAAGTFGLRGWLLGAISVSICTKNAPLSTSPSVSVPEGKSSPNSALLVVTQSPARSGRVNHPILISVYLHTFTSLVLYLNWSFLGWRGRPILHRAQG